jgi:3-dehydroquinate dehydratase II
MKKILLINGPNLNLIGKREESIYGNKSFDDITPELEKIANDNGADLEYFQSNHEGDIIDRIHQGIGNIDKIILNPGALTHYSYSIHDAILSAKIPVIEVHISNIYARDRWRSKSVISPAAEGVISGFGLEGYIIALNYALKL